MDSSANSVTVLVIFLTTLNFLANVSSTRPSHAILVVCNRTMDRDSCISSLSSYPGASQASISQLAVITAKMSLKQARNVSGFIVKLNKTERASGLVAGTLKDCVEMYELAVLQLEESLSVLRKPRGSDKGVVNSLQSAALTDVVTCVDEVEEFAPSLSPLVEPRSLYLEKMIDNALSASNLLYKLTLA